MSESPESIRADIDRTREELGLDVDALADKVSPSKIAHRQTDKIKGAFGSVRERIMGAADDAGSSLQGAGSSAASGVSDAAHNAKAKVEGNPLAVGLIAFGAGLVLASLIPASAKEKEVASAVKEQAQPLVDEAQNVAKEVGAHLKEPAQDAVAAVKETATDAVENVKSDATDATATVTDRAQDARDNISNN
jgi:gas vesicle protein